MATVTLQKTDGSAGGNIDLADAVFGAEINERVVRAAYNQFMAGQRAGTHSTKTRGMVSGGGRKPFKQKGTGRARQGTSRSPLMRGGAVVFGPSPRDYSYKINRKEKRAALVSALSSHAKEGTLTVVESLDLAEPKTKLFRETVAALGLQDARRLLVVTAETNKNLLFAARNLQHVKVVNANNLNIFDLLTAYQLVLTKDAADAIAANLSSAKSEEVAD